MSPPRQSLVVAALREPRALPAWPLGDWDLLVRQARSAKLLSRLAALLADEGVLESVPAAPRPHLEGALLLARAQDEALRREVTAIAAALENAGAPIVLLKGAAYLFAGLPAARGRLFSDVDILVPRERLPQAEAALMLRGWTTTHLNAYDQRYYRRWMHELPPLVHVTRQTVLDVHHTIVPPTARFKPDAQKLLAASRPIAGDPALRVLAPADMVLHSATHLFLNEELGSGLRDLADLDALLRDFGRENGFWDALPERARALDLARPLYYALRYTRAMLGTPVPAKTFSAADAPPVPLRRLMDALFLRALQPPHAAAADRLTALARSSLYVRAHWLRMPPALLALHLAVKALRSEEPKAP